MPNEDHKLELPRFARRFTLSRSRARNQPSGVAADTDECPKIPFEVRVPFSGVLSAVLGLDRRPETTLTYPVARPFFEGTETVRTENHTTRMEVRRLSAWPDRRKWATDGLADCPSVRTAEAVNRISRVGP